jgi:hypothetical protein
MLLQQHLSAQYVFQETLIQRAMTDTPPRGSEKTEHAKNSRS